MLNLSKVSSRLMSAILVIGVLGGCATQPQANSGMMMNGDKPMCSMCTDKSGSGEMSSCSCCRGMMKNMSPDQMKVMKQCMGGNMMGGKIMSTPSDQSAPQTGDAAAADHQKHHPQQ